MCHDFCWDHTQTSNRQHLSNDDCLDEGKIMTENCSVLYLCCKTVVHRDAHTHEQFLKVDSWFGFSLDLDLIFVCFLLFCSCVVCFSCVRFSFFRTKLRDWVGRTSLKWPVLCWVGCKTLTQSILSRAKHILMNRLCRCWDLIVLLHANNAWLHLSHNLINEVTFIEIL